MHDEEPYPRFLSRGRAFVYVLPCRDDTLLKIGFSREPLQRLQTLHRRFFEFFDLDRAVLIETDRVREARAIERRFMQAFNAFQAPAPFVVPEEAGGHTEWFRGILDDAIDIARMLSRNDGHVLHDPISTWLRDQLTDCTDLLYGWSLRMLDAIEFEQHNVPSGEQTHRYARALRDVLDAYSALHIDIEARVPADVLRWHEAQPS